MITRILVVTTLLLHLAMPTWSQGCDPNYSPCVPIASDVDCAGGSGNGPAYVEGPVTVNGSDIYGLDRDGDGVACE
ncbi:excalibur calcium-binding domain-containing protein [Pseudosulfitobacter pseudonitzschiae]